MRGLVIGLAVAVGCSAPASAPSAPGPAAVADEKAPPSPPVVPVVEAKLRRVSACGRAQLGDDDMYAFLTSGVWGASSSGSGSSLALRTTGEYRYIQASDYLKLDDRGEWNFQSTGPNTGLLCFSNGAVLSFERQGRQLRVLQDVWQPGSKSFWMSDEEDSDAPALSRGELPKVFASEAYTAATAHPWRKANDFDTSSTASELLFRRDGTFEATYRDGNCKHGGRWGLYGEWFISASEPNTCNARTGDDGFIPRGPLYLSGNYLLFIDGAYRASDGPNKDPVFFVREGVHHAKEFQLEGRFLGRIEAGQPVDLELVHRRAPRSPAGGNAVLRGVYITMAPLVKGPDQGRGSVAYIYARAGDDVQLLERRYDSIPLKHGAPHRDRVTITMPEGLEAGLVEVVVHYHSPSRPMFLGKGHFIVPVRPPRTDRPQRQQPM